jgi:ribA/ribD-fused uncharacterized protein
MPHSTDEKIIFLDSTSKLANHQFLPFYANGIEFKTMTHYLEYHKALMFNEKAFVRGILNARTAADCVKSFKALTHDQLEQWYTEVDKIVRAGLRHKVRQNPELVNTLLKTDPHRIVLCDDNDGYWSCGLTKEDAAKLPENLWPGKNKLGEELHRLRAELHNSLD